MKKTKPDPQHCYYALRSKHYDGAWHVVMVFEGKAGYRLVNPETDLGGPHADEASAKRSADYWNKALKLTPETVNAIVTSSMNAGQVKA